MESEVPGSLRGTEGGIIRVWEPKGYSVVGTDSEMGHALFIVRTGDSKRGNTSEWGPAY